MLDSKPVRTLLATSKSLSLHDGAPPANSSLYRETIGSLQYLLIGRPDIAFEVNKLSQFIHDLSALYWGAVKCLLHYLNGTRTMVSIFVVTTRCLFMLSLTRIKQVISMTAHLRVRMCSFLDQI